MQSRLRDLESVERTLGQLQSSTETEFMAVGATLVEISQATNTIFEQIRVILVTFSGEKNLQNHGNIIEKLEGIRQYTELNLEKTAAEVEVFQRQKDLFNKMASPLNSLNKMVFQLNTLGFSIKAETTRIRQQDNEFAILGEEVRKLAVDTREKLDMIRNSREEVIHSVVQASQQMTFLKENEFSPLMGQVDRLLQEASTYDGLVKEVEQQSEYLGGRFQEINRSIGEIIFELQFHDIVRQQIEHVQETITRLKEDLTADADTEEEEHRRIVSMYATSLLSGELIENARQTVMKALGTIMEKFSGIQTKMEAVGEGLASLVNVSLSSVDTMVRHAAREKERIEATLFGAVEVHSSRLQTIQSILDTAGNIRGQIREISSIGEDIGLISLNGLIQAHHLKDEGMVMGVVIGEIRSLVDYTQENVTSLVSLLEDLETLFQEENMSGETVAEGGDSNEIIKETRTSLGQFFQSLLDDSESAGDIAREIRQQTADYSRQIASVRANLGVGEIFDSGLSKSVVVLQEFIADLEANAEVIDQGMVQEMLQEYRSSYTMASERQVHDRVVGDEESGSEELFEDLQDNVELF